MEKMEVSDDWLRSGRLVPASKLQSALAESTIVIHNPPDFPADAFFIGVLAVGNKYIDPNKYSWMVTDFLSWKLLMNGVGHKSRQNWCSTVDIVNFAETNGLDLNEGQARTRILGEHGDDIVNIPTASNTGFLNDLKAKISHGAIIANDRKTTLVIAVFSPVTPENDICIDLVDDPKRREFLTKDQIQKWILGIVGHDKLPIILITTSPFTGGWVCCPSLFPDAIKTQHAKLIRFAASSCGAAFADHFMNEFTKRDSPLLTERQREKVRYYDMMPVWPTAEQTYLLGKFQRGIHETLQQRLCTLGKKHGFDFAAANDVWPLFCPRNGFTLLFWRHRWTDVDEADEVDRFEFLGEAFGGSRLSQLFHLKYLVKMELDTCPCDWARNMTGVTFSMFRNFYDRDQPPSDGDFKRVFDAVEFRGSSIVLAKILLKALELPTPKPSCRLWEDKIQDNDHYDRLQLAFAEVNDLFPKAPLPPGENRNIFKDIRFYRAARWVSCAIASRFAGRPNIEIKNFIEKEVAPFIEKIRVVQEDLLREHPSIIETGKAWLVSLDIGIDVNTTGTSGKDKAPMAGTDVKVQASPAPVGRAEEENPVADLHVKRDAEQDMERKDRAKQKLGALEDRKKEEQKGQVRMVQRQSPQILPSPFAKATNGVISSASEKARGPTAQRIDQKEVGEAVSSLQDSDTAGAAAEKVTNDIEKSKEPAKPLADTWEAFYKDGSSVTIAEAPKRILKPLVSGHWKEFSLAPAQSVADIPVDLQLSKNVDNVASKVSKAETAKPGLALQESAGGSSVKTTLESTKVMGAHPVHGALDATNTKTGSVMTPLSQLSSPAAAKSIQVTAAAHLADKPIETTPKAQRMTMGAFSPMTSQAALLKTSTSPVSNLLKPLEPVAAPASPESTSIVAECWKKFHNILAEDPQKMLAMLKDFDSRKDASKAQVANTSQLRTPQRMAAVEMKPAGVMTPQVAASSGKSDQAEIIPVGEMTKVNVGFGRGRLTPPQTPANFHLTKTSHPTNGGTMGGEAEFELGASSSVNEEKGSVIEEDGSGDRVAEDHATGDLTFEGDNAGDQAVEGNDAGDLVAEDKDSGSADVEDQALANSGPQVASSSEQREIRAAPKLWEADFWDKVPW